MTASTGQRSFRACLRCRRRKTKCGLDGPSDQPPCRSCRLSGNECILVQSKRGKQRKGVVLHTLDGTRGQAGSSSVAEAGGSADDGMPSASLPDEEACFTEAIGSHGSIESEEETAIDLRNPSDALEILARTDEHSVRSTTRSRVGRAPQDSYSAHAAGEDLTTLDGYELLVKGVLNLSVILQLVHTFAQVYHPYCPVVPNWFLSLSFTKNITKSDHFLLTILLTIASRDAQQHELIHRACWNHAHDLLLKVFLTHSSFQTPRTVEGLLLLAEWLPHIECTEAADGASGTLFGEDRLAWSIIGLAIRQAYLLRLDRGAFRQTGSEATQEQNVQKRLIWHFVYLADRHISVRLGQSFWSRGPSLSSHFTADDFPSLQSKPGNSCNPAAVLQANLELVQVLYNAHLILYASSERTSALIRDGDYARYLDDFISSATLWQTTWQQLDIPSAPNAAVFLTYEYICLYVNAFSFQAVLARSVKSRESNRTLDVDPFNTGAMSSPDGLYVAGATSAATKLLQRLTSLHPQNQFQYLPSRFFLYGVYAAVFLHKAISFRAIRRTNELDATNDLLSKFIYIMREAPETPTHVCRTYSEMLEKLQRRHRAPATSSRITHNPMLSEGTASGLCKDAQPLIQRDSQYVSGYERQAEYMPDIDPLQRTASQIGLSELSTTDVPFALDSPDEFTIDSLWPGIAEFSHAGDLSVDNWAF